MRHLHSSSPWSTAAGPARGSSSNRRWSRPRSTQPPTRCSSGRPTGGSSGAHELPGLPMHFSGLERWYRSPAPTLGQHTEEVLRELLGLRDNTIAELRAEGIIGVRPAGL